MTNSSTDIEGVTDIEGYNAAVLMPRPATAAALGLILLISVVHAQQPSPRFRSGVDVVGVDVTVVDDRGRPIEGLGPSDFTVRIDGRPRRVVSAEFISQ